MRFRLILHHYHHTREKNRSRILKKKKNSNFEEKEQKFSRITQRSSTVEKTQVVLNYMRKLRLSLLNFVQEIVETSSHYRQNLIRKSTLIWSFISKSSNALDLINQKQDEYRRKLRSIFESKYFKNWNANDINPLKTISATIIAEMKNRASRLLSFFRFVIEARDSRSERWDMKNRWIIIISIFCFIYKSRTCV